MTRHLPKLLSPLALCCFLLLASLAAAQTATGDRLKDEMGLLRLQVVYPQPGETIEPGQPMISADASHLETPLDPQTVVVVLNGAEVTDNAEIAPSYIVYQPMEPLPAGRYEVRIMAKNVKREDIEPLAWTFTVAGEGPQPAAGPQADNTSGRLIFSSDYIDADYTPQSAVQVPDLFREKEGSKLNVDFNFSNISEGRTILAAYRRETQYYTDVELDKARMNYFDSNFSAALGHFWFRLTPLTVMGTELAGMRIDKQYGRWTLTGFGGRTQDPSTGGTFKQSAGGVSAAFAWDKRNTTHLTSLAAWEYDDPFFAQASTPARDEIASLFHEYRHSDNVLANIELATNMRREQGSAADHDGAFRLYAMANGDMHTFEAEAYRIDENFLPIAEGSARFLKSDRDGYRVKASVRPWDPVNIGGEYEEYDIASTGQDTRRHNAFVSISHGALQSLTWRTGQLKSNGTVSDTDGVAAIVVIPASGNFTETRIAAGWQNIDYSGTGILTDTTVVTASINTWYRDRLGFSTSYSITDSDNILAVTSTKSKNLALGLNWNIIPFKLMWTGRYERLDNSGSSVGNEEERIRTTVKYTVDKTYAWNFGYDRINYDDSVSPVYTYDQHIFRTGMEMNF